MYVFLRAFYESFPFQTKYWLTFYSFCSFYYLCVFNFFFFVTSQISTTVQPSTNAVKLGAHSPALNNSFVAASASVVGKVKIGKGSSVWYGAVVRGDVNNITIGEGVTIGDRVMIHCSGMAGNNPTVIGNNVVVGAGAIIHGAVLEDESSVGAGAQVMDTAVVQKHAIVQPGALVGSGKIVKSGQVWGGVPAVYIRDATSAEKASIATKAAENNKLASIHAAETSKTWEQVRDELEEFEQENGRADYYYRRLTPEAKSFKVGEIENHQVPGRIFDSDIKARFHAPP
jgi:carbonic anhydrase/acetyltransferase-like protein (isoleucine patch superfamily)